MSSFFCWIEPPDLTPEQEDLVDYLGFWSEDTRCAQWLQDMEFWLWHCTTGAHAVWDESCPLEHKHHRRLQALSARCQGWFVWDEVNGGPRFVSLAEWLPVYAAHQAQRQAKASGAGRPQ